MGVQEIIVAGLFLVALVYVVKLVRRSVKPEKECGGSCKCGVDFSKIPNDQESTFR